MPASFPFQLVTPQRTILDGQAEQVIMHTEGGDIAFLANHIPFIGVVEPCMLRVLLSDQSEKRAAVHGGFVEVRDEVAVVAGVAELPDEIDAPRAERALQEAESRLASGAEDPEAELSLARAKARLETVGTS